MKPFRSKESLERRRRRHLEYILENPQVPMFYRARSRATTQGVPFEITKEDIEIPEICPVLGIPLRQGKGQPTDNSPSLDKYIPSLGYVKGNINVISNRANTLKSSATTDEVILLLKWMQEQDAMSSNIKEDIQ